MGSRERRLYVYALADPGLPGRLRLSGRTLVTLRVGPLEAVVGRADEMQEMPTLEALGVQHAITSALHARSSAMLPARFGTALTERELGDLVEREAPSLLQALDAVRGRAQMTVRLRVTAPARETGATARTPSTARSGRGYLDARRRDAVAFSRLAAAARRVVGDLVAAEELEPRAAGGESAIFHLVALDRTDAYRERASALQKVLRPSPARVTGPWPPFAFVPKLW